MEQIIRENPIIAILRNLSTEKTLSYVEAVYNGGIKAFEVAMNSKEALKQIEMISKHFSDKVLVGAGTAINIQLAADAVSAGAKFLLTPSTDLPVLDYCNKHGIELLPGVMTPTDVSVCVNHGYKTMKLFPAGDLPPKYIKSLQGPFDGTNYVAVGGVGIDNINTFFERGFLGVGIGSQLIPSDFIDQNRWDCATQHVQEFVKKMLKKA